LQEKQMEDMPETPEIQMTDALCIEHVQELKEINKSLERGDGRMERIERELTDSHNAVLQVLKSVEKRMDELENRQTTIEQNQNPEVKYWRLGKRIVMLAGLPAIVAWLAVIAKFIKVP